MIVWQSADATQAGMVRGGAECVVVQRFSLSSMIWLIGLPLSSASPVSRINGALTVLLFSVWCRFGAQSENTRIATSSKW
jgi:hypothetical protein